MRTICTGTLACFDFTLGMWLHRSVWNMVEMHWEIWEGMGEPGPPVHEDPWDNILPKFRQFCDVVMVSKLIARCNFQPSIEMHRSFEYYWSDVPNELTWWQLVLLLSGVTHQVHQGLVEKASFASLFSDWPDHGRLIGLKADGSPLVRPTSLPPGGLSDEDRASEGAHVPQITTKNTYMHERFIHNVCAFMWWSLTIGQYIYICRYAYYTNMTSIFCSCNATPNRRWVVQCS